MKAHVDGDVLTYSIGFATEEEPLNFCLNTVKQSLNKITGNAGCDEFKIFLTGKTNFRDAIATVKPYKGNRKSAKPKHYQDIRDYMIEVHKAEVSVNCEADDLLGLQQTNDTVLCTTDKDLDMIAGKHYNFHKKHDVNYNISQEYADRWFFIQWLAGDSVDNIAGLPRVGVPTAKKLLTDAVSIQEMYDVVLEKYGDSDYTQEEMEEMGSLVWMMRPKYTTFQEFIKDSTDQ